MYSYSSNSGQLFLFEVASSHEIYTMQTELLVALDNLLSCYSLPIWYVSLAFFPSKAIEKKKERKAGYYPVVDP